MTDAPRPRRALGIVAALTAIALAGIEERRRPEVRPKPEPEPGAISGLKTGPRAKTAEEMREAFREGLQEPRCQAPPPAPAKRWTPPTPDEKLRSALARDDLDAAWSLQLAQQERKRKAEARAERERRSREGRRRS